MQWPGGFLGDTLGPRRVLFAAALISVAGNFFFSMGSVFFCLAVAQVINGLGQGPGITSAVKLIVNFSRKMAGTATGFMVSFGCLAAIIGMYASGLLVDLFRSYGPLFLSFAFLAFLGTLGVCFVRELHS